MAPTLGDSKTGIYSRHLLLLLLLLQILEFHMAWCHKTGDPIILRYRVEEESPSETYVGNIIQDAKLQSRYSAEVIHKMEFYMMKPVQFLSVGPGDSTIRTLGRLDRESIPSCRGKQFCEINQDVAIKPVQYFEIVRLAIEIGDINDNAPSFRDASVYISMLESAPIGSGYALPAAQDPDSPAYGVQRYYIQPEDQREFRLDVDPKIDGMPAEAKLMIVQSLDRERTSHYRLKLVACDVTQKPKCGSLDVIVFLIDSNDNSPVFESHNYSIVVKESLAVGSVVLTVKATDADSGLNGEVVYVLTDQSRKSYGHVFAVNNRTGSITTVGRLDREVASVYQLMVVAYDRGPDGITSETTVVIRVDDVNDNPPNIVVNTLTSGRGNATEIVAEIAEDSPIGTFVAHITTSDADVGDNGRVTCHIDNANFRLTWQESSSEYQLLTARLFDRETLPSTVFRIPIVCRDNPKEPEMPAMTSSAVIFAEITDVNDCTPSFLHPNGYKAKIKENISAGTELIRVTAEDCDATEMNSQIFYSIVRTDESAGSNNVTAFPFRIKKVDGSITTTAALDREFKNYYKFLVVASDRGSPSLSSTAEVLIVVDDVNDEVPVFSSKFYDFIIDENQPIGTVVGRVYASDLDEHPFNVIRYSFANLETEDVEQTGDDFRSAHAGHFSINTTSGEIRTEEMLDREATEVYRLVVMATDQGHLTSNVEVMITVGDVNDNPPTFEYPSSTDNVVYISNLAPRNNVIARLLASDRDSPQNGHVTYAIENEVPYFSVDRQLGTVSVNERLADRDLSSFLLELSATDSGSPARSARANLTVVVNSSVWWLFDQLSPTPLDDTLTTSGVTITFVVVVCLASLCIAMTVVVIAVCLRCRSRRRRTPKKTKTAEITWFTKTSTVPCNDPPPPASKCLSLLEKSPRTGNGKSAIFKLNSVSISPRSQLLSLQADSWLIEESVDNEVNTATMQKPDRVLTDKSLEHHLDASLGQPSRGGSNADSGHGHSDLDDDDEKTNTTKQPSIVSVSGVEHQRCNGKGTILRRPQQTTIGHVDDVTSSCTSYACAANRTSGNAGQKCDVAQCLANSHCSYSDCSTSRLFSFEVPTPTFEHITSQV